MNHPFRWAIALAVLLAGVSGAHASYRWTGFAGDPPRALLPAAVPSTPSPANTSTVRPHRVKRRFWNDRDVQVLGTATIVLAGICCCLRRPKPRGTLPE